ncbi:uncharacterized protein LOC144034704 isoform X2 [Vanacampus margaritifer]
MRIHHARAHAHTLAGGGWRLFWVRFSQASVMARCRSHLRGLDICVTLMLTVCGVVMIAVAFSSVDVSVPVAELFEEVSSRDGLLVLEVFGPLTVLLSLVGVCAAALDFRTLLLLFSGMMFVEFVSMLVASSPLVQLQVEVDAAVDEAFVNVMPLHLADPYVRDQMDKLQAQDACCGLRGPNDWGAQLPASCFCVPDSLPSHDPCTLATAPEVRETFVHSKPCGPILKSHVSFPIKLRIGIISTFATLAVNTLIPRTQAPAQKHVTVCPRVAGGGHSDVGDVGSEPTRSSGRVQHAHQIATRRRRAPAWPHLLHVSRTNQ